MPAPRAKIGQKYRFEEVDLQPFGNTISVEAPSDNPFEDDRDVEIVTQASGGLAGPDRKQRSRGVLVSRPRNTRQQGGRARAFRVTMDAAHPGFMPGMGAIERPMRRAPVVRRARITHPGFMPGMGDLDGPIANRRSRGFMPGMGDDPVPAVPSTTGSALTAIQQAGSTVADVLKSRYQSQAAGSAARTQQAMATAEMARAEQMRNASLANRSSSTTLLAYGLMAGGAALLTWALFLRKKK